MRTRAKMMVVASDRARRENVPKHILFYANNEPKSALARDLGDCRDNKGKLAKRVFTCCAAPVRSPAVFDLVVHKRRISCYTNAGMWQKSAICFLKMTKEGTNMNYMICIPSPRLVSREYCERIHNILARMSDQYRVNIVPEPVKMRQGSCPDFYKKYRIYKDIKDRDGNGEAYLTSEEENMILSVCRNPEEVELMKSCTYAYRYPTTLVLKSFREDKKR